ncbi:MAG: ferritin-like domain-containing protein [Acidimicrobiales bacterium]
MRKRQRNAEHAVAEHRLAAMTADLDQLHHDVGVPALDAGIAEWREHLAAPSSRPTSRRTFLLGVGGALAGAGVLAAVTSSPVVAAATRAATSKTLEAGLTKTLKVAALAASLENLAVYAYGAGLAAAKAGKLGTVPPAVATFATTARSHHTQHAAAWNALLTSAGKHKITATEPTLTPTVNAMFAKVTDVTGLAELALLLENTAAQTYQAEASRLGSEKAVGVAATIQPVEMQHAAILYYVLGKYPGIQSTGGTPLAFNPTSMAA